MTFNNSIFPQIQCCRHLISVKRCVCYRGTFVQKHLAYGKVEKDLDQRHKSMKVVLSSQSC